MSKFLSTFSVYWHFILDILLTHIFVIAFLKIGYPSIAAMLMAADSFIKVAFSVLISKIVAQVSLAARGKICLVIRFVLILLWVGMIMQLPVKGLTLDLILPYFIFKLLLLIDSTMSSEFVFSLRDLYKVDLTQSTAAQNIMIRSSTAIAPAIALLILFTPHAKIAAFIVAVFIYLISLPSLLNIFFHPDHSDHSKKPSDALSFKGVFSNSLMRWGLTFQLVGNLAFAGVAFLLLSQLKPQGSIFWNEITFLYTAFFIAQFLTLIYGEKIVPVNTTRGAVIIMAISSLCILFCGLAPYGLIRLILCAAIGITYSFLLSAVQKVVTTRLRGAGFVEFVGWAQMISRSASFTSTILLGVALSIGFNSSWLLFICGLLGIAFSALLSTIG
jgi:hypothetical protein